MATDTSRDHIQHANVSPLRTSPRLPRRSLTLREVHRVEEQDIVPGRIFWLPRTEELPPKVVRRAHGKGAVEEGIYNHPVIILSRPAVESRVAHFHIITSFQGKRLDEIYSKSNEFHASRRSWYLPISPSPPHPDATSKKTQKRFPTLSLAQGATLRWDSYVNIRHVYRIDWTHLKPYCNPDTPLTPTYQFDPDTFHRMVAKTKVLTNYEPGPQHQPQRPSPYARDMISPPTYPITSPQPMWPDVEPVTSGPQEPEELPRSPKSSSDTASIVSEHSGLSPILRSDFGVATFEPETSTRGIRKKPPDGGKGLGARLWKIFILVLFWPIRVLERWRRKSS